MEAGQGTGSVGCPQSELPWQFPVSPPTRGREVMYLHGRQLPKASGCGKWWLRCSAVCRPAWLIHMVLKAPDSDLWASGLFSCPWG